jgi:ATPase subunit of ABC transporter with duplicated ATPase domains
MAIESIFSMSKLSKTYQGADKPVSKKYLFWAFYGAKIGILGLNGSETLLKIIAERIKLSRWCSFALGYTVVLEQEPILDDSKTVIEIVKRGVAETMAVLDEFNKINDSFGLPEVYVKW